MVPTTLFPLFYFPLLTPNVAGAVAGFKLTPLGLSESAVQHSNHLSQEYSGSKTDRVWLGTYHTSTNILPKHPSRCCGKLVSTEGGATMVVGCLTSALGGCSSIPGLVQTLAPITCIAGSGTVSPDPAPGTWLLYLLTVMTTQPLTQPLYTPAKDREKIFLHTDQLAKYKLPDYIM